MEKQYNVQNTGLENEGFIRDTAGGFDLLDNNNIGFETRRIWTSKSRVIELEGDLNMDLASQSRPLLNGVELILKFWPHDTPFILMAATSVYNVELLEAHLKICKITPNPDLQVSVNNRLKKEPAVYPYYRKEMKTFQISS